MNRVLILGGYGNFGKRIAHALARHHVPLVIAGRHRDKAEPLAERLRREHPGVSIEAIALDAETGLAAYLERAGIAVVVNTCGPFQNKNYRVAETCIAAKAHYVDLADGRDFVTGITSLDASAKAAGVCIISGASTVPGLSSAVIEHYRHEFSRIEQLKFGISPGQKAERGLATTAGILSYVGKPLRSIPGDQRPRFGWQDIYRQKYPELGYRWMANCDIPDLDLFPEKYGIQHIQFSAGMESPLLHFGIWSISWLVRMGLPLHLERHAPFLLRASHWFDRFGSDDGGMHVIMTGLSATGNPYRREWFIVAKGGDGPQIPCVPAIVLARKLAEGTEVSPGACPCVGLVSLDAYLEELARFAITTYEMAF